MDYITELFDLKTPCNLVDVEKLDGNIDDLVSGFKEGWGSDFIAGYSMKTNSLPWIITHFKKKGFFAEVVSEQEYRLAKYLGYKESEIIVNGPVKSPELIVDALNNGAIVNLDNWQDIRIVEENLDKATCEWSVGLRFNFNLEEYCPDETIVADRRSRFGFCVENGDFEKAVECIRGIGRVSIAGLHGHNSTKGKSLEIFREISKMGSELNEKLNLGIRYFDIGGCFFGDKKGVPSFSEYARTIADAFGEHADIRLIAEPGASLVASPISYLCEVQNRREIGDRVFVTVDGGLVHIDPMMHGIRFDTSVHYAIGVNRQDEDDEIQEICGFTCMEMDRMGVIEGKKLIKGDRIEFLNCGSYSMTLSPLFISYLPEVYIRTKDGYHSVRKSWDETEFMQKCEVDE